MYNDSFIPFESKEYIIKSGDTLQNIAEKHDTSVDYIISINPHIVPSNLRVGQKILLPNRMNFVGCDKGTMPYIIQEGDTLSQLAIKFNVSLSQLMKANPRLNPYALFVGQRICIPKNWEVYSNKDYNVSFMYPATWKNTNLQKYEGKEGFFQVAAIGSRHPLKKVCKHEAFSRKRSYGNEPKFIDLEIENQEGMLIYPSKDQDPTSNNVAALVLNYPQPIELENKSYNYLVLWANKSYIRQMGSTLSFLKY